MNFFELFFFSFLVALTGAMSPGPLLTFTIYKTLKSEKKGYLIGFLVIAGHALLEFVLILLLLAGVSFFLQNATVLIVIGLVGGSLLCFFGVMVIRDVVKNRVRVEIEDDTVTIDGINGYTGNSILGGILVSMSNPYWWLWWAAIGLGFMVTYDVRLDEPLNLLSFFLGHEMGDLIWYVAVSAFVFFGGKAFNNKVFNIILVCCGVFMVGFGLYLAIQPIVIPPTP
jgi:threonine/homoserine/homoserine lactone efflux protein